MLHSLKREHKGAPGTSRACTRHARGHSEPWRARTRAHCGRRYKTEAPDSHKALRETAGVAERRVPLELDINRLSDKSR
ncbi:hypothetical protein AGOR_G00182430 [Albula goreensis]|uniref:Uncharacterized protein n=1 Tax=Albula goreensis TaxID=1534307 RepID=A0A8T3CV21_9TELE|nr:hypothetical protein AGOR_G00182430 [Albula goreensis]